MADTLAGLLTFLYPVILSGRLAGALAGAKNRESEAGTTPIQKRPRSQYRICAALAS